MKLLSSLLLTVSLWLSAGPAAQAQQADSPYRTRFVVDAPITVGRGAVSGLGLYLVRQKNGLTPAQLAALDKNDVPKFDRFAAGNYSDQAQLNSDVLCYGSLVVAPGLLALNDKARGRYGQVAALYLQTMLATDAVFTMSVGTVTRYRPFLYGSEGAENKRGSRIATNSFFAGHTAHTATATFFAAKVFHDFNPDSPAEPFVWGAAALVPAAVAYYRIEAGKHFLSDNLVGYALGATMGIVVPQLHKTGGRTGVSLVPVQGLNANGHAYGGLLLTKAL
ncbi:phosphatase PAP2 family protein [Hymenobacter guriensis]|uniref:Phosphatase PAP2 family protein n=1 Tax=Hymenobacter guriensis TaxID=2793065 RepID=A0ABS0KVW0_9BACT|nr:phosphatase PAP2 family protein [Hymenobacter guriensis]MBG8552007.1 phosphatase PAP2 family protein [Hymenobacter guriensis]